MQELLEPLSSQWQIAFLALVLVMGALIWRGHRQTSMLARTSAAMREQLARLAHVIEEIEVRTQNTEHTLIANLSEYRMALGSTSAYRDYLQKLGVAPAADIEPLLEAIPDGAIAIGKDGKVLYANRVHSENTGVYAGMTLEEIVTTCDPRTLGGERITLAQMPESRVLRGEEVREELMRLRPESAYRDAWLSVNGSPIRDVLGRVVAAMIVARPLSEEVALAMGVRKMSREVVVAE